MSMSAKFPIRIFNALLFFCWQEEMISNNISRDVNATSCSLSCLGLAR
jgi:hypothetical protein